MTLMTRENQPPSNGISRRDMVVASSSVIAAASIQGTALITPAQGQQSSSVQAGIFSSQELTRRTTERRAVEAAIWGMPIVNFDAMRQAFFRDAKAMYGDIMFWSKREAGSSSA